LRLDREDDGVVDHAGVVPVEYGKVGEGFDRHSVQSTCTATLDVRDAAATKTADFDRIHELRRAESGAEDDEIAFRFFAVDHKSP